MKPAPRIHGIVPPVVTPLLDPVTLDDAGLERLVEHLVAGGVHGLFALGTTGEAPSLDLVLKHRMVARTCELVRGRAPERAVIAAPVQTLSEEMAS
jgi:4-hydroxy-tetrahydrodipicolinate synthase